MARITLTKRKTNNSGNTSYARDGVRASVYINKQMFTGTPPETIELDAENLTEPGAARVGKDPAKALAKAAERATKAQARAEKALAVAEKLKAQAAKLAPAGELVNA